MKDAPRSPLAAVAALFEYPNGNLAAQARRSAQELRSYPDACNALERFAAAVDGSTAGELQENYTATFDFTDSCALDLGWHIFRDSHERGAFIASLREDLGRAGIEEAGELPDHLTLLLRLLAHDPDGALAARVGPAVERLHSALRECRSPYVHATEAVRVLLATAAVPTPAKESSR